MDNYDKCEVRTWVLTLFIFFVLIKLTNVSVCNLSFSVNVQFSYKVLDNASAITKSLTGTQ